VKSIFLIDLILPAALFLGVFLEGKERATGA
jgi:hypothetical protein